MLQHWPITVNGTTGHDSNYHILLQQIYNNSSDGEDRIVEHMYLGYFNHIKEKTEHLTSMFKVNSPHNESLVVWRCPSISCEMETTRMFLES